MPHDSPSIAPSADLPATRTLPPGLIETILTILAYFVLQFGFGLLFGGISALLARSFPTGMSSAPDRLIVVVMLTVGCSAWVILRWLWRRWGAFATERGVLGLGFAAPEGRFIAIGTALGIAAPLLGGLLTQWLAGGHEVSQTVTTIADQAHVGMRAALLPIVVLAGPLVEEVLFRGAFLARLRARLGDYWAIAVSAIVFGTVHLPDLDWLWYAVPNLVLVGLFCAWLRVRSGSIWPPFVAHAANNALATFAWFAAASAG